MFLSFEDFFWLLMSYSKWADSDSFSCCPCVGSAGPLQTWSVWHSVAAVPVVPVLWRAAGVAPVTQLSTKQVLQPSALLAAVQSPAAGFGSVSQCCSTVVRHTSNTIEPSSKQELWFYAWDQKNKHSRRCREVLTLSGEGCWMLSLWDLHTHTIRI